MPSTILVVDDHHDSREITKMLLGHLFPDHAVVDAETVDEALALATEAKDHLGLVIFDLAMPGRSGIELLKELDSSGLGGVPRILLTGWQVREDDLPGRVNKIFLKPPRHDEFIATIQNCLKAA